MLNIFCEYLNKKEITFNTRLIGRINEVSFSFEELNFLFMYSNDAPSYFRMMLPRIFELGSDDNQEKEVRRKIDELNLSFKVAKAIIVNDGEQRIVWIVFEQFAYSEIGISHLFDSGIAVLRGFIQEFRAFEMSLKQ
ncbi:hypothetical protein [Porphyromonas sp. COT-290 OH3588]|uniref:hypothetical protein n=1 Tax=Porphyromonas sp. COT-290 OH3588 TaxID=1515617 RepID=UPI00052C6330|nr:hypothetical protein [Porphyromonas sp. COT-290 OH3588]KGO01073.1 hypothetical protein HQ48_03020 [Porphyromonas sp. COT-290 OH3588]